jgi:hypothetical protein
MYLVERDALAEKFDLFKMEQAHDLWSDSELKFAECFRISLATLVRLLSTTSLQINKII